MPTAAEAAAILRRAGILPAAPAAPAEDFGQGGGQDAIDAPDTVDPVATSSAFSRPSQVQQDMADRVSLATNRGPNEDRLRGDIQAALQSGDANTVRAKQYELQGAQEDYADASKDPSWYADEHARTTKLEDALGQAATTQRPEIGAASETSAKRNALAEFLKVGATARATNEAAISPAGRTAADLASGRKIAEAIAPIHEENSTLLGGAGGGGNLVEYWARQLHNDPGLISDMPANKGLRNAVAAHMEQSGGDMNKLTAQTRAMGEIANEILPLIDDVQEKAKGLQDKGLFTPGVGLARRFLAQHGLGSMVMGPDTAREMTDFQTSIGYIKSAIAKAHMGVRGAGSPAMVDRFDKLVTDTGDYPSFLGGLDATKQLLSVYGTGSPGTRPPARQGAAAAVPDTGAAVDVSGIIRH